MTITPASIRNLNPGAMYPGPSARKFGARTHEVLRSKDGVHKIATFPSAIHGAAAQFDLLHNGRNKLGQLTYRGKTVRQAIETWCGGFYVGTYLKVLSAAGVSPDEALTSELIKDPARAIPLCQAMARQEAGREFPLDADGWKQAHEMAFSSATAPAFSPENDVPSPKPETRAAAVTDTAVKVAAGATAVTTGVATATAPVVPPPPVAVTQTVETISAYQSLLSVVGDHIGWLVSNPLKALAAAAVVGVVGWVVPAMSRRLA